MLLTLYKLLKYHSSVLLLHVCSLRKTEEGEEGRGEGEEGGEEGEGRGAMPKVV